MNNTALLSPQSDSGPNNARCEMMQRVANCLIVTVLNASRSNFTFRYLQTLNSISAEKNSTIVFPVPMDMRPKATS